MSKATDDVLAERQRQINVGGWTETHDDEEHAEGDLAMAAACYAAFASGSLGVGIPNGWPWASAWWKPKSKRLDLVRAAALMIAEIERLDRSTGMPIAAEKHGCHVSDGGQRDANLLQGLRELCGYVEDSSQAVLQISQDDASREWCLCIREKTRYHATSFRGVIDEAIATEKQTCEHKERRITGIAELCGSGLDKEKS